MILSNHQLQIDAQGHLRHFLDIDGLSSQHLTTILDNAESLLSTDKQKVIRTPVLQGITVANVFFEASTRTRATFELAAKHLSADVLTIDVATSSSKKGETLLDTIHNLQAMGCELFVIRHPHSGAAYFVAQNIKEGSAVLNAGDGCHAHPTQAMLDMLTIRRLKGDFHKLSVAIIGDIKHSRVARSQILALNVLGCQDIRVIAPKTLLPSHIEEMGVRVYNDIEQGLKDIDVVMVLRLQKERMQSALLASETEFHHYYGLNKQRLHLMKADAIIMHPGPINRGVEISSDVADGKQSVILQQVHLGVAVRMAVMVQVMKTRDQMKKGG